MITMQLGIWMHLRNACVLNFNKMTAWCTKPELLWPVYIYAESAHKRRWRCFAAGFVHSTNRPTLIETCFHVLSVCPSKSTLECWAIKTSVSWRVGTLTWSNLDQINTMIHGGLKVWAKMQGLCNARSWQWIAHLWCTFGQFRVNSWKGLVEVPLGLKTPWIADHSKPVLWPRSCKRCAQFFTSNGSDVSSWWR